MATQRTIEKRVLCPACGKKGKRVGAVTLRALLKNEYRATLVDAPGQSCGSEGCCTPVTEDTGWRFCDSPECEMVYFSEENGTTFTKSHLKVPVGVKERTGDRPLCYCFEHSVASIKQELHTKGGSDALDDIRRKMKDPGCSCEVTNPSGSCCLGSVGRGIEIAKQELGITESGGRPRGPSRSSSGWGEKIAKIGTLVSAVMASSNRRKGARTCCCDESF